LYFQAGFDSFAEKLRRWSAEFQYILNVCSFTLVFRSKGVRVRKEKMAFLRDPLANFFWPKNDHFLTDRGFIRNSKKAGDSMPKFLTL
jgi:hypothetical protein